MTMNPLPPQAYTKDTLTKAYLWLLHQNDSIKELATTPDILVTLFLKAQRNGDESLDTPSIQNFKNELKSLAGMMGELDKTPSGSGGVNPAATTSSQNFRSSTAMPPFSSASVASNTPSMTPAQPQTSVPISPSTPIYQSAPSAQSTAYSSHSAAQSAPQPPPFAPPKPAASANSSYAPGTSGPQPAAAAQTSASSSKDESFAQLDGRSRAMIAEVREQLNLGSDVEVLRLFISLGYQKARNLYS